jgi:hypothetical protein
MPVRKRTPYPNTPVRARMNSIRKFDRLNIRVGFDSVPKRRIRKRTPAMRNRKNPIVITGAIVTVIFADGQDPPQNAIAITSMA